MAIFKPLHSGETIKALKGVVRYNSLEKKGFNSDTNPRLIGVHSNIGHCDNVNDKIEYNELMNNFVLEVESNSLLKKNSRQKYLYEHSVISFSEDDDKNLSIEKLTELALKITDEANPDGAPFVLWPQIDSGKLHYHLVRGLHDQNGNYQKKKHDFHKMNNFVQKLEVEENLTLTGKNNPDNYIYKTLLNGKKKRIYFPGNSQGKTKTKVSKNKEIDQNIKIEEKGNLKKVSKLKEDETKGKNNIQILSDEKAKSEKDGNEKIKKLNNENEELHKPIKYNLFNRIVINNLTNQSQIDREGRDLLVGVNNKNKKMIRDEIRKSFKKLNKEGKRINKGLKIISSKIEKVNEEIKTDSEDAEAKKIKNEQFNSFRKTINEIYRKTENAQDFLKTLNENNIEIAVTYNKKNGGISFNSLNNDISLAGGKVNSYLTYGKIKKNDPELFSLLTGSGGFGEITLTNENSLKVVNLNKNYKEKINDDGSISIFFHKKNADKYPHNHNLKINADKNKISFGQSTNEYDIKLAYELAKKNSWTNGISDNKELILKSMKIAYSKNKNDLFFFKTKEPSLKIEDIKKIVGNDPISKDNLIKLYDDNLLIKEDKKEALVFIKKELRAQKIDVTDIDELLKKGLSLKDSLEESKKIKEKRELERELERDLEKQKITNQIKVEQPRKRKSQAEIERDKMRGIRPKNSY